MLLWGRAPDFDLRRLDSRALRHIQPGITSQLERIDRISYYGSADAKIVLGNSVSHTVADIVQRGVLISELNNQSRMACL